MTLACPERFEREGWTNWTTKDGTPHVQPPVAVLEQMLTLRLHLDPCSADNGPLRVVPDSHSKGRLSTAEIQALVEAGPIHLCECAPGEVLAMRPLLVHSSNKATSPARRRVIHLEFCPVDLLP